jgi:hypothetical protein
MESKRQKEGNIRLKGKQRTKKAASKEQKGPPMKARLLEPGQAVVRSELLRLEKLS